ncbi:MAG: NAD(P)-dependent oxidoreductase [Puniceicoccales bacterium]
MSVAEHAILLVLACLRALPRWQQVLRKPHKDYESSKLDLKTQSLARKKVGLHGFGNVAQKITELLQPYDVTIGAYSQGVPDALMHEFGVQPYGSLSDLFANSEILIECESLTEQSRHSVTAGMFALLPDDGVFVNVGRGALVDESALADEIRRGRIRLGTDVFACEPLPPDSEFHELEGAVFSPHIAGPTQDLYKDCGRLALENIQNYTHQLPLKATVTLESYLRST